VEPPKPRFTHALRFFSPYLGLFMVKEKPEAPSGPFVDSRCEVVSAFHPSRFRSPHRNSTLCWNSM